MDWEKIYMKDNYNYDNLNPKTHILMYSSLDNFMKYNPPCKECLIQNMCIKETIYLHLPPYLIIKRCDKLTEFLLDDNGLKIVGEYRKGIE